MSAVMVTPVDTLVARGAMKTMFTPEQGMSINPYRQVTAIAADFARRGGRIVRDRVVAIEIADDRVRAEQFPAPALTSRP